MAYEKDNPLDGRAAPALPEVPVLFQDGDFPFILLNAASGRFACSTMGDGRTAEEDAALAAGIMHACNSYATLVAEHDNLAVALGQARVVSSTMLAVLRDLRDFAVSGERFVYPLGSVQRIGAAIAAAEGR
jgi:hypothetical protein